MKKIVYMLILPLMFVSCETEVVKKTNGVTETQTVSSGDVVESEILKLMSDVEKGMKPMSKIAEIKTYDAEAKPYLVGEKETGNFNSEWENGDYKISRFYSKKYNDSTLLGEARLSIVLKDEAYYNPDTDEEDSTKKIDFSKYLNVITEKLGVQPEDFSSDKVWKTGEVDWYMGQWDDYSLEFRAKK